jgi:hypothetical protein
MNILRQPPFPIEVSYSDLEPSTDYILEIYDDHSKLIISELVESDGSGDINFELPSGFEKFDDRYSLYVYTVGIDDLPDATVVIDTLYIYRPYINPMSYSDDDCDAEEYIILERTARQIIDTLVGGFYYSNTEIETAGLGADYLPLSKRANRINQVYENNVKIYDRVNPVDGQYNYIITPDKTAMTIQVSDRYNRAQSKSVHLPIAASDSFMLYGDDYDQVTALTEIKGASMFPKDWDYVVYGEFGWPVVPQDIKDATGMLVNDLKCGKLSYAQKYITEYETDQFRVKYSDLSLRGTGNLLVDKILEGYSIPIYRLGVL